MTRTRIAPARTRWYFAALVGILLLGWLLRVFFWTDQARASNINPGDEDEYYRGAVHLFLHGDYYDNGKWLRPPLTSLYLAGAFRVFGLNLPAALLFHAALSLLSIALIATLVRRIFRRDDYAITAALAAALFLPFAAYASRVLSENIFIIFLSLALVLLERAWHSIRTRDGGTPARYLFFAGVAFGLATLTRAFLFYFVPLLLLWFVWERGNLRRGVRAFAWLALGFALVILPWTARNYAVYHQLVLVETEAGFSFLVGTQPDANEQALQDFWTQAYPNSAQRQQAQFAKGFENVRRAPLQWIAHMRDKLVRLWHLHVRNLATNGMTGPTLQQSSVAYSLLSDVEYIVLALAALVGLATVRRDQLWFPLLALPLYTTLLGAITVTSVRIREPLMIVLIVYAAPALTNPRRAWRGLRAAVLPRKLVLAGGLAIFALLIYSNVYPAFLASQWWLARARLGGGEAEIQRAIQADQNSVLPYLALGDFRLARGDANGAVAALTQAQELMPNNTEVAAKLIAALRASDAGVTPAALEPIREDGGDDPQWYEWAWARVPYAPRGQVDLSAPAVGVMRGVYAPAEQDGTIFRWTLDRAQFRVSNAGANRLSLRLRADSAEPVEIFVDGELVQRVKVTFAWADYLIALKHPARAESLIELRAPIHLVSVDEPYPRGVAIAALKLE